LNLNPENPGDDIDNYYNVNDETIDNDANNKNTWRTVF
jgi:hypothetical protein